MSYFDDLLARADYWLDGVADSVDLATGVDVDLVRGLAFAVRDLALSLRATQDERAALLAAAEHWREQQAMPDSGPAEAAAVAAVEAARRHAVDPINDMEKDT